MVAFRRRLACGLVVTLLVVSTVMVVSSAASGQESDGDVVVRIVARRAADGRVEIGLQQRRSDGSWSPRMLPPRRALPTTATVGRWLATSPLTVSDDDGVVRIVMEVRVVARRAADLRFEFGLQQRRSDGSWSPRMLPPRRFVPAAARVGRWLATSPLTVSPPRSAAQLATLQTAPEQIAGTELGIGGADNTSRELCATSGTDPYTGLAFSAATCYEDYIVGPREAYESGGFGWDEATWERFHEDPLNLVAARVCVHSSGGSDMADWSYVLPVSYRGPCWGARFTAAGRCFLAERTVAVKYRYNLAVDATERTALAYALNRCYAGIDAAVTPRATITTAAWPDFVPSDLAWEPATILIAKEEVHEGVRVYDAPDGDRLTFPDGDLVSPTWFGTPLPLVVRVIQGSEGDEWAEVELPVRPNGSRGWIRTAGFEWFTVDHHIFVDLSERSLAFFNGDELITHTRVIIGRSQAPTPALTGFIVGKLPNHAQQYASIVLGAWILPVSFFSEVLDSFAGDAPRVSLHGTHIPGRVGEALSNFEIRIPDGIVEIIAEEAPLGTVVRIVE